MATLTRFSQRLMGVQDPLQSRRRYLPGSFLDHVRPGGAGPERLAAMAADDGPPQPMLMRRAPAFTEKNVVIYIEILVAEKSPFLDCSGEDTMTSAFKISGSSRRRAGRT
jgi:hypothetical protein